MPTRAGGAGAPVLGAKGPLALARQMEEVRAAAEKKRKAYEGASLKVALAKEAQLLALAPFGDGDRERSRVPPAKTGERPDEVPPHLQHKHLQLSNLMLDKVPLNVRRLATSLCVLDISYNDLEEVPKLVGELPHLSRLHVEHNLVTHIAPEVARCTSLSRLFLHNNRLSSIPVWLGRLPRIDTFTFGDNPSLVPPFGALARLGWPSVQRYLLLAEEVFGMMPMVEELRLVDRKLDFIPEFPQLRILTAIDFSSNQLGSLPKCVANLEALETLDVRENKVLQALPLLPGNLRELQACGNAITNVLGDANVMRMRALQFLDLSRNAIVGCMPSLAPCVSLREVYLNDNRLEALSAASPDASAVPPSPMEHAMMRRQRSGGAGVARLAAAVAERPLPPSLEVFHAHRNSIAGDVGNAFREPHEFPRLRDVNLSHNCITRLDINGAGMPRLATLRLSHNQILDVPEGLAATPTLHLLEVDHNRIDCIPEWLGSLVDSGKQNERAAAAGEHRSAVLQVPTYDQEVEVVRNTSKWGVEEIQGRICLNNLGLLVLPDFSRFADTLGHLLVSRNQLVVLPRALCHFTSLQALDVSGNRLTSLPQGIGTALTRLRSLYVYRNQLTSTALGFDALGGMCNLEALDCSHNANLTEFPDIFNCTELITFVMTHTGISEISMEIASMTRLTNVYFDENPNLIWPPPQIMQKGNAKAFDFLKELAARELEAALSTPSSSVRESFDSSPGAIPASRRRTSVLMSSASVASSAAYANDPISLARAERGVHRTAKQRWQWVQQVYIVFHRLWREDTEQRHRRALEKRDGAERVPGTDEADATERMNDAQVAGAELASKNRGRRRGVVSSADVQTAMTEVENKAGMQHRRSEVIEELHRNKVMLLQCTRDMRDAIEILQEKVAREEKAEKAAKEDLAKKENFERYAAAEESDLQRVKTDTDNIAQKKARQRRRKSLQADGLVFASAAAKTGDALRDAAEERSAAFGKFMMLKERYKNLTENVARAERDKSKTLFYEAGRVHKLAVRKELEAAEAMYAEYRRKRQEAKAQEARIPSRFRRVR